MILGVPADTPVIAPEVETMEPKAGLLLLHVPPVVVQVRVAVPPAHIVDVPPMAGRPALTFTAAVRVQPAALV